jgi:hypothetical protein
MVQVCSKGNKSRERTGKPQARSASGIVFSSDL